MATHRIRKGLDLPILGRPVQSVGEPARSVSRVAVLADDFPGMKPRMAVAEGDTVRRGQVLFEDRKRPGVLHTAPGAGRVVGIYRGARRALQSVVVHLSESEQAGQPSAEELQPFEAWAGGGSSNPDAAQIRALLLESGQWCAFRTRPYSKVPLPDSEPHSIFVNAMDTNPMAIAPARVLAEKRDDFDRGLARVAKLTRGPTYLCVASGSGVGDGLCAPVQVEEFAGPHPAGTAGLHIHTLDPVSRQKTVWTIGYQDVVAIGRLFATGVLDVERDIALGGPVVPNPRCMRTRLGASIEELTEGEIDDPDGEARLISGSVLSGKKAGGNAFGFLGRYDTQISALHEGTEREFFGSFRPASHHFSVLPIVASKFFRNRKFAFTTNRGGSHRDMVPLGLYERVMPLDIEPTFLLRSMTVADVEMAEKLGVLELDEEDLALCTFVCPGKTDWGPVLRRNLELIEEEG